MFSAVLARRITASLAEIFAVHNGVMWDCMQWFFGALDAFRILTLVASPDSVVLGTSSEPLLDSDWTAINNRFAFVASGTIESCSSRILRT